MVKAAKLGWAGAGTGKKKGWTKSRARKGRSRAGQGRSRAEVGTGKGLHAETSDGTSFSYYP